jgi:hypothetical protein
MPVESHKQSTYEKMLYEKTVLGIGIAYTTKNECPIVTFLETMA